MGCLMLSGLHSPRIVLGPLDGVVFQMYGGGLASDAAGIAAALT